MFSRSGARDVNRGAPTLPLGAALVLGAFMPLSTASAQDPGVSRSAPSALYATIGGTATTPTGGFDRTGAEGGGIAIAGVFPMPRGESWVARALALRLEFSDIMYGDAPYEGSEAPYAGDRIYAGIRTHAIGLQLTRPGQVHIRPYGSVSVGDVKMLLDAERLGKLDRRSGVGMVARAGSYFAFTRGSSPFVLELTAAYHANGTREHWREGSVTTVRGPTDFLELSVQLGVAVHDIW